MTARAATRVAIYKRVEGCLCDEEKSFGDCMEMLRAEVLVWMDIVVERNAGVGVGHSARRRWVRYSEMWKNAFILDTS